MSRSCRWRLSIKVSPASNGIETLKWRMREVVSTHPAGTIGVPVGPLARYRALYTSLERLQVPQGTQLVFKEGADVGRNCDKLAETMRGDWLWIMGGDQRFGPHL